MGVNPVKLKLGMLEEVEYDPGTFDFISVGAVFEHLYHPYEALEKSHEMAEAWWIDPNGSCHLPNTDATIY
jgi:hypothetical protein